VCTRLAAASDEVYQLLAHGWWFSPGHPASSTKTVRHDSAYNVVLIPETIMNRGKIFFMAQLWCSNFRRLIDLIFGVLTPLSTIFQLYHGLIINKIFQAL
jgi:hypothetical protein